MCLRARSSPDLRGKIAAPPSSLRQSSPHGRLPCEDDWIPAWVYRECPREVRRVFHGFDVDRLRVSKRLACTL
jgi:hypothetical protein